MNVIKKNKLPLTIAVLVCFLVITLTFNANNATITADSDNAADSRRVIVLDAGHGEIMINIVFWERKAYNGKDSNVQQQRRRRQVHISNKCCSRDDKAW